MYTVEYQNKRGFTSTVIGQANDAGLAAFLVASELKVKVTSVSEFKPTISKITTDQADAWMEA